MTENFPMDPLWRKIQLNALIVALVMGVCGLSLMSVTVHAGDLLTQGVTVKTEHGVHQLQPIPMPNVTNTELAVQEVLRVARAELAVMMADEQADSAALATAYGEMGELYHVHHIYVPAESCYRNAMALVPEVFRWPYYLGYLAQQSNQLDLAGEGLQQALKIRPDYAPAQVRLAQVLIEQNKHEQAEPLLRHTLKIEGLRGTSLFGLGRIALARRDFEKAIALLKEALENKPQALRIHYTLAMAYRGLGNIDQAKIHLAQFGDGKPDIADPEVDRLKELMSGVKTYYHHALGAVRTRQYDVAAKAFAAGLKHEPENVNARVSLARALYLSGESQEALVQLQASVQQAPDNAMAQFLLGILLNENGNTQQAILHYRKTLSLKPNHAGAHHFLGNALMGEGHYAEAVKHLAEAYRQTPQNTPARMMEAIALLRSGGEHDMVKQRLEALYADHPEQPVVAYALARLLAASPEDEVRDGERALIIVEKSLQGFMPVEYAETRAMAYAEVGRFEDAVNFQVQAISVAFSMGMIEFLTRLENTLALYRDHKPSRSPWVADDPLFRPLPVEATGPFRDYPTNRPY
ncbi:MAG: tetratricopeptide repeat protein [Gammaproteobacteria bacterium]|nr:tetratricopeptide repeat protein [Gammaproteobacteria bacterium]